MPPTFMRIKLINDEKARDAADWLIKSGLAAHGYQYVHIGDTWQGIRDKKNGEILPNRRRFPDPKDLARLSAWQRPEVRAVFRCHRA